MKKVLFIIMCVLIIMVANLLIRNQLSLPMLGPGVHDFSYPVAGKYMLTRSSAHEIDVVPEGVYSASDPVIPSKVVEIAWDNRFVIAKRQGLKRRTPNDPDDTYMEPDPAVFDYWILDTKSNSLQGRMTQDDFSKKISDLNLADSLTLKDVYSYRNSSP